MKSLPVGEFKAQFSSVLKKIEDGESVTITYGKNRRKLAVLVPYHKYKTKEGLNLGIIKGKARCRFSKDFKVTDEDFLES